MIRKRENVRLGTSHYKSILRKIINQIEQTKITFRRFVGSNCLPTTVRKRRLHCVISIIYASNASFSHHAPMSNAE